MKNIMPLRRVVVELTNEASPHDFEGRKRAIRGWHNRLNNGSIPRHLVLRLGRQLFLDLNEWDNWVQGKSVPKENKGPGRPRSK